MMAAALYRQEREAEGFSDGLRAWVRGDDLRPEGSVEAETFGLLIGEIGIRWLKVLRSKFEKE